RGFWEDWFASYGELGIEQEEILDLGNGVVFAVLIQKARLVGGSGEVRLRYAAVGVWADGLVVPLGGCTGLVDIGVVRDPHDQAVLIQKARLVGGSGEVRLRYAAVGVWADGLVVRVTNYTDVDEARAAAERLAEERG